jgi:two-component system, OmpR family, sensor histidine kinase KdpD
MSPVRVLGSGPLRGILEAVIALAAVGIVTLLLDTFDADQTAAALTLVVLGVALSFVGTTAIIVGILASFASLNYFFTPPSGSFGIGKNDDLVALVALGVTTGVLGATIARVNRLRRRSDRREQEIRVRLELSNRLADGDDPDDVIRDAEVALRTMFDLDASTLRRERDGTLTVHVVEGGTPIAIEDRSEIAAFVMGLGTSLERLRLTQEVRDVRVEAAIEQSRASFLSAMTHNLRTPLATIKTALSTLRSAGPDPTGGSTLELLDTAYGESDRLEQLVSKVLALSRIRAGAVAARPEPVDLSEATQGAVQRLRLLAAGREIGLDAPAGLPLVSADPALLDVTLVNVLENALRYAPESAIEVRGRRAGTRVRIEVVDHGPGIATADRERVFDEFVRIDSQATSGTGIGLSIARAFVGAQRGEITIEETAGGGTTVVIALPVQEGTIP